MSNSNAVPLFVQRYASVLEGFFRKEGGNAWSGRASLLSLEPLYVLDFTHQQDGTSLIEFRAVFDKHTSSALLSETATEKLGVCEIKVDIFHARAFDDTYMKKLKVIVSNAVLNKFQEHDAGVALNDKKFHNERAALIREHEMLLKKMALLIEGRTNEALSAYAAFEDLNLATN